MVRKQSIPEKIYVVIIFILLYVPLIILAFWSFNDSISRSQWGGFTFRWYIGLFQNEEIMSAVATTAKLTVSAAIIATILGTLACIGMIALNKKIQGALTTINDIPMLNADIVTGIALMLLFMRFIGLGFTSMLIAHVTLTTPYVILNVMPKIRSANTSVYEAALDLGASPVYAFFRITLPEIFPGILSGFLMAFTLSLDDFVVTYFTKGPGINTISTMIYQQMRRGINPQMYALSTILFVAVLVILLVINRLSSADRRR